MLRYRTSHLLPLLLGGLAALVLVQVASREAVPPVVPEAYWLEPTDVKDSVTDPEWGKPVEGLQYRVRADRLTWQAWEQPLIWLDVRNASEHIVPAAELQKRLSLLRHSNGPCVIQEPPMTFSRGWRVNLAGRHQDGAAKFTDLAPRESLRLPVVIGSEWRPLDWGLGTDVIQIGVGKTRIRLVDAMHQEGAEFYSNVLRLQILPPGVRNWHEFEACLKSFTAAGQQIDAGFVPARRVLVEGQPLLLTFVVRNPGHQEFKFDIGGDYRGVDRHNRFQITVHDDQGELLPDPSGKFGDFGGGLWETCVAPGRLSTEPLDLTKYRTFSKPGRYTVSARFELTNRHRVEPGGFAVPVKTKYRLTILPRTSENVRQMLAL